MALANGDQKKQVAEDLTEFVHRVVALGSNATPAEIAALPEVAKVLCTEALSMY